MSVKLKPTSMIIQDLGIGPNGPAHAFFTECCRDEMRKYVPKDNGDLRRETELYVDKIVYTQEYARYQFYGMREDGSHEISHWTTPGTGPRWDQKMISADMPKIVREVNNYVKRGHK